MVSARWTVCYFAGWLLAVGVLAAFSWILCRRTPWLCHLLMLAALFLIPLARPALAMRAFATNRSSP
jgi:hypothetical protein